MEISKSSLGTFYVCKLIGLAPYSIKMDNKNRIHINRSIIFTIWSVVLIASLLFLTYRGVFIDASSHTPIRASFRMKSGTSKVVTGFDVSVVVVVSLSGVLCGLIGLRSTQELNCRLHEVDQILISCTNIKKDQIRTYTLLITILGIIFVMIGLDIWTWMQLEIKMNEVINNITIATNVTVPAEAKNVHWYFPFYGLYIILTGVHINFAQTAVGIGRRYRRLNVLLKRTYLQERKLSTREKITPTLTISKNISQTLNIFSTESNKKVFLPSSSSSTTSKTFKDTSIINAKQITIINRLAYTHESLGKAMKNVTEAFGLTVLCILVSCLLHLVATAYFLLLEFIGNKNSVFAWLQFLWILFHAIRLLLIVEPCHVTSVEASRTIDIVCEIARVSNNHEIRESLQQFWQQLLSNNHNFSALGMCVIDRGILTSFSGAIATYLVILIQFQNTSG